MKYMISEFVEIKINATSVPGRLDSPERLLMCGRAVAAHTVVANVFVVLDRVAEVLCEHRWRHLSCIRGVAVTASTGRC